MLPVTHISNQDPCQDCPSELDILTVSDPTKIENTPHFALRPDFNKGSELMNIHKITNFGKLEIHTCGLLKLMNQSGQTGNVDTRYT